MDALLALRTAQRKIQSCPVALQMGFAMNPNSSIRFFDTQFQKQVADRDFALNPFEKAALPFVHGRVLDLLDEIQAHVAPNGRAIINVLTAGTTYMGMFDPGRYYLFGRNELEERFRGWDVLLSAHDSFDAPDNTKKEFATIVARKR